MGKPEVHLRHGRTVRPETLPGHGPADPGLIPADYYSRIRQYSSKPLIIAESGWPSGGDKAYHGSKENQKKFLATVDRLSEAAGLKLWIWWFLHDWEGEGYPAFFKTMGLRNAKGKEKLAWKEWRRIGQKPFSE